jgi:class 3 adenylate cyclase
VTGELSVDDLSRMTREPPARIREWLARGWLGGPVPTLADVERVHLVRALQRRGLPDDVIDTALRDHASLIESFVAQLTSSLPAAVVTDFDAAAAEVGMPRDLIDRVVSAAGLEEARIAPTAEDLAAIRTVGDVLSTGVPESVLLQMVRVYTDALERVADAEVRLFHLHVHESFRSEGLRVRALLDATDGIGAQMEALVEPTLLYFHRKAWKKAIRHDLALHVLEELGVESPDAATGTLRRAVTFVDLSGFTPLTDAMGDMTAASVLDRYSKHVRDVAQQWGGTFLKSIGDGFMLVFLDSCSATEAVVELGRRLGGEPRFPAFHAGIDYGPVLYREGDYLGATVNVAARLATQAGRGEILLTAAARRDAGPLSDVEFTPLGSHAVKGLHDHLELFRADVTDDAPPRRQTDPVCGMQLAEGEIAARMTIGGDEYVFCSTACLGIFTSRRVTPG